MPLAVNMLIKVPMRLFVQVQWNDEFGDFVCISKVATSSNFENGQLGSVREYADLWLAQSVRSIDKLLFGILNHRFGEQHS
jgi:hypothetical protein